MDNREIDKLIGTYVFGYRVIDDGDTEELGYQLVTKDSQPALSGIDDWWLDEDTAWNKGCCRFSTSISAAWLIFDALPSDVRMLHLEQVKDGKGWRCIFQKGENVYYQSLVEDTAPLAICAAVLKVYGVDIRTERNIIPIVFKGVW